MARQQSFTANLIIVLIGLLALLLPVAGDAQTVVNTAHATWNESGKAFGVDSNTFAFAVVQQPVTIATFVGAPRGGQPLTLAASTCGDQHPTARTDGAATTLTVSAAAATSLHIGETFYFRVVDHDANRDANAIDSLTSQLTTSGGDKETITIFETGPDTGVFIGAVPAAA